VKRGSLVSSLTTYGPVVVLSMQERPQAGCTQLEHWMSSLLWADLSAAGEGFLGAGAGGDDPPCTRPSLPLHLRRTSFKSQESRAILSRPGKARVTHSPTLPRRVRKRSRRDIRRSAKRRRHREHSHGRAQTGRLTSILLSDLVSSALSSGGGSRSGWGKMLSLDSNPGRGASRWTGYQG
jgi:hypothetical protein